MGIESYLQANRIFICGAFGSGKTEISLNLALAGRDLGLPMALVDLDVVNLYFRSRQMKDFLKSEGIRVIDSSIKGDLMDLPALSAQVGGALTDDSIRLLVDVGGDDVGATVLGRYEIPQAGSEVLMVVNPYRPFTDTPAKILEMMRSIEERCRLKVTATVANGNIGSETDPGLVMRGLDILNRAGTGVPIAFISVSGAIFEEGIPEEIVKTGLPVLRIRRFMEPFARQ